MSQVMINYAVKPDRAAENERLVRAVYTELEVTRPAGLAYATFVLEDGVSFSHFAATGPEDTRNPLEEVSAFSRFLDGLDDRLVVPLTVTTVRRIGSYGGFRD